MAKALTPTLCYNCEAEIELSDPLTVKLCVCPKCQREVDLDAQFAYSRGLEAFSDGQDLLMSFSPRRKWRHLFGEQGKEATRLYMQAHSSLTCAFRGRLAASQRQLAIEMMASITALFQSINIISPLEAGYWHLVMVEKTAREEIDSLSRKLDNSNSVLRAINPIHWYRFFRKNQLSKKIIELRAKLKAIERQIGFVEPPKL